MILRMIKALDELEPTALQDFAAAVARTVFQRAGKSLLFDRLPRIKSNVLRLWVED